MSGSGSPRPSAAARKTERSTAAVDRDRQLERHLVAGGNPGLQLLDQRSGSRCCDQQSLDDLLGRGQLHELLLERPREPPVAQIPAVELLQEARRASLAELAHRLADEEDQLGGDLLASRLGGVAVVASPDAGDGVGAGSGAGVGWLAGAFVGGFLVWQGLSGPRPRATPEDNSRLNLMAFLGGTIFLYGARMARGCTSGQAPSGGATLAAGSWLLMFAIFGSAYALAYFVRKLWN